MIETELRDSPTYWWTVLSRRRTVGELRPGAVSPRGTASPRHRRLLPPAAGILDTIPPSAQIRARLAELTRERRLLGRLLRLSLARERAKA